MQLLKCSGAQHRGGLGSTALNDQPYKRSQHPGGVEASIRGSPTPSAQGVLTASGRDRYIKEPAAAHSVLC